MGVSIQDIYIRESEDKTYRDDVITYSDGLEQLISMIKMILTTKKGDVLGDPDFGVSIEEQIFSLNVSLSEIEKQIKYQISKYINIQNNKYRIDVNTNYVRGTTRDAVYIDILIDHVKYLGVLVK